MTFASGTGAPFLAATWPARAALHALGLYKTLVSPLLPGACRFVPTCSEYAAEAIRRHGLARGTSLAARRLARCRPGAPCGHDPVP